MERIGILGVGWRDGGVEALARFTVPRDERSERIPQLARALGAEELIYLATCNRVEVLYVASDDADDADDAAMRQRRLRFFTTLTGAPPRDARALALVRTWRGEDAAHHALLVAAGLDAARPGETEIAGQVREAAAEARRLDLLGPELTVLTEESLRAAARVRRLPGMASGKGSLAEIALDHVRRRLALTGGGVALVGVSPMTRRCARALAEEKRAVVVANRGRRARERLAGEISARAVDLDAFRAAPPPVEVVVCATAAPGAVLGRADLERLAARTPSGQPPLVVDLSVPADVDPRDARDAGCPRVGLQEILDAAAEAREGRLAQLEDARLLVDASLRRLKHRVAERRVAPLLGALQRRYRRTAIEGVERLLDRQLEGLGEEERAVVREWAVTLARRFAHIPSLGLRGLARHAGPEGVEAFLSGLDDGLARALRREGRRPARRTRSDD